MPLSAAQEIILLERVRASGTAVDFVSDLTSKLEIILRPCRACEDREVV